MSESSYKLSLPSSFLSRHSTRSHLSDVTVAVQHLREIEAEIQSADPKITRQLACQITGVIEALQELETEGARNHERLEIETIKSSVLRHKLLLIPERTNEQLEELAFEAKVGNEVDLFKLKEELKRSRLDCESMTKKISEINASFDGLNVEKVHWRHLAELTNAEAGKLLGEKADKVIFVKEVQQRSRGYIKETAMMEHGMVTLYHDLQRERSSGFRKLKDIKVAMRDGRKKKKIQVEATEVKKKELDEICTIMKAEQAKVSMMKDEIEREHGCALESQRKSTNMQHKILEIKSNKIDLAHKWRRIKEKMLQKHKHFAEIVRLSYLEAQKEALAEIEKAAADGVQMNEELLVIIAELQTRRADEKERNILIHKKIERVNDKRNQLAVLLEMLSIERHKLQEFEHMAKDKMDGWKQGLDVLTQDNENSKKIIQTIMTERKVLEIKQNEVYLQRKSAENHQIGIMVTDKHTLALLQEEMEELKTEGDRLVQNIQKKATEIEEGMKKLQADNKKFIRDKDRLEEELQQLKTRIHDKDVEIQVLAERTRNRQVAHDKIAERHREAQKRHEDILDDIKETVKKERLQQSIIQLTQMELGRFNLEEKRKMVKDARQNWDLNIVSTNNELLTTEIRIQETQAISRVLTAENTRLRKVIQKIQKSTQRMLQSLEMGINSPKPVEQKLLEVREHIDKERKKIEQVQSEMVRQDQNTINSIQVVLDTTTKQQEYIETMKNIIVEENKHFFNIVQGLTGEEYKENAMALNVHYVDKAVFSESEYSIVQPPEEKKTEDS